jgi:hypothetical protein
MNENMMDKIIRETGCDAGAVEAIVTMALRELHLVSATDSMVTTAALIDCLHRFGVEACYHLGGILAYHDDKTNEANDPEYRSDSLVPETMLRLIGNGERIKEIKAQWFQYLDSHHHKRLTGGWHHQYRPEAVEPMQYPARSVMDDRDRIIASIAEHECKRIARKVVRALQGMTKGMQSGDDSGLVNLWDEVCVQVQGPESVMWDYYVEVMREVIEKQVHMLSVELTTAIWLQTDNGFHWDFDEDKPTYIEHSGDDISIEYSEYDIVDHILSQFVLKLAADWTNRRIEKFINEDLEF